jgi:hypothetical protein
VAEPGGAGRHRAPLAPLREGMAPLVRLVWRPPAGSASGKIGGRSKKKGRQNFRTRFLPLRRPKKIFMPPPGRNPGSATEVQ